MRLSPSSQRLRASWSLRSASKIYICRSTVRPPRLGGHAPYASGPCAARFGCCGTRSFSLNPFVSLSKRQPARTAKLATLIPGNLGDAIRIYLGESDLAERNHDCISYDRSQKSSTRYIDLNGTPKAIPEPLHDALESIRDPREPRLVWADAFSGSSPEERSKHAGKMTAIFQHSRNVLCYLGPGGKRSAEAFDMLQILARWWHEATVNTSFPPRLGAATVQELENIRSLLHAHDFSDLSFQDSAKWQEVEELFSASYFKSAQTLPDILLGQNTMIWSGNRSLSWQDFLAASHTYLFLATKRHEQLPVHLQEALEIFEPIETAARRHREGQELELLPMMLSTRHSAASAADPRECIFALLPIIGHAVRTNRPNGQRQPLPVLDYAKGASEVFQEAAKFIIEERQDFALWWSEAPPSGRGIQGMPSWVPDWSTLQPRNHAGITPDCGLRTWADNVPSAKRIFVDEASALHVQAHHFDRIEYTSAIFTEENYRSILLQTWESCYPYAKPGQDIQNSAEDPFMQTCVRALVLDQDLRTPYDVDGKQRPSEALWQSLYSLLAEECILRAVRTSRPGVDPSQMTREEVQEMQETNEDCKKYSPYVGRSTEFAELFLNNSLGRRFFKTEKAMLGMTAIETPAANTTSASGVAADKPVPSTMDGQFRDPMARTMLEGFQRFLATKDPKAAEPLSRSMTGRLPGQTAPGARPGDLVVALVGGLHPYILRAVTPPSPIADPLEADAKHIFVGECHLQGVMEGECFQVAKEDTGIQWREDVELTSITIV